MSAESYYIKDQQATYFLTFTVQAWVDVFTRSTNRMDIVNSLNYCVEEKGLHIYAWCLMSDHLHLVCRADENLSTIIRDFKKFTTKKIINRIQTEPESRRDWMLHQFKYAAKLDKRIKNFSLWQPTSHPIVCDETEILEQKIDYTHQNPVRRGMVANAGDYLFSSARDCAGEKSFVKIELV
jgi:putative transposase